MEKAFQFSQRKLALAHWLLNLHDEKMLIELEALMEGSDILHSSEVFNEKELAEIAQGEADYAAGRTISLEDFKKQLNKYAS